MYKGLGVQERRLPAANGRRDDAACLQDLTPVRLLRGKGKVHDDFPLVRNVASWSDDDGEMVADERKMGVLPGFIIIRMGGVVGAAHRAFRVSCSLASCRSACRAELWIMRAVSQGRI
ncbi:hypothetical protein [Sphingomonas sp. ABOLE]|uniref:hypothetical protein n=1 Tax=Sphingomonas sp. ABOLE TaxID=1985878 RepID=UPI0019D04EA5|nr:hypothetical protein [Sphingomonas sp. ABOLE]